jgi:hypothetical protein
MTVAWFTGELLKLLGIVALIAFEARVLGFWS